jgi:PAS domain S-box-containing protein
MDFSALCGPYPEDTDFPGQDLRWVRPRFSHRPYANRRPQGQPQFNTGSDPTVRVPVRYTFLEPTASQLAVGEFDRPTSLGRHRSRDFDCETGLRDARDRVAPLAGCAQPSQTQRVPVDRRPARPARAPPGSTVRRESEIPPITRRAKPALEVLEGSRGVLTQNRPATIMAWSHGALTRTRLARPRCVNYARVSVCTADDAGRKLRMMGGSFSRKGTLSDVAKDVVSSSRSAVDRRGPVATSAEAETGRGWRPGSKGRWARGAGKAMMAPSVGPRPEGRLSPDGPSTRADAVLSPRIAAEEVELRRLAAVVDSSADAILSKDCDCRITSWNRGAESLYGGTASEIVGQPVGVLVPADRAGEEHAILDRLVRGDDVGRYETQRLAKDGSVIDVAITVGGDRRVFNPPRHHRAAASKRGAGAASRAA